MSTATFTSYEEFDARISALPEPTKQEVIRQRYQAMGYVWGFQDAGGGERDTDDSWRFGFAYACAVLEYKEEKRFFLESIQSAYKQWKNTGRVEA